jgi:hypothetical protein
MPCTYFALYKTIEIFGWEIMKIKRELVKIK